MDRRTNLTTTLPIAELGDIHDRMYRLRELLSAADQIASNVLNDKKHGPLYAIIQVSLIEAQHLDRLVSETLENPRFSNGATVGDLEKKVEKS